MTIKLKLQLNTALLALMALAIALMLGASLYKLDTALKKQQMIDGITQKASQLAILTAEVVHYHKETRVKHQWQAIHKVLADKIGLFEGEDLTRYFSFINQINTDQQALERDYKILVDIHDRQDQTDKMLFQAHKSRVLGRLNVSAQSIVTNSSRLREAYGEDLRQAQQYFFSTAIAFTILMSLLIIALVTYIGRKSLRSLETLQSGIQKITGGDLDSKIEIQTKDEIGEVAQAFNFMTESLSRTMSTRQELETIVEERTKALEKSRLAAISVMEDTNIQRKKLQKITQELEEEIQVRTEIQKELVTAKELAERATQAKSIFLANMSHEIRTPMNSVLGMIYLLKKTSLEKVQLNYVNRAYSAATSLLGIINDILDFSKIEAGKLTLEKNPFSLEEQIIETSSIIAHKAEQKGIEFIVTHDSKIPDLLIGDFLRLRQVLINLCNNAIKFTESGEVVLSQEFISRENGSIEIKFCVKDTGIGISKKQQEKLFHEFSQVDDASTRKFGGTGLGLVISKKLVHLMGGNIWLESSEPNQGSTFCFTTRLEVAGEASGKPKVFPNMDALSAVVVDDNESARDVLGHLLSSFGLTVTALKSGEEAVKYLSQNQTDLVIMDWKMPGMSGIETTYAIRANETITPNPKIILVTAYGNETLFKEAESVGFDGLLLKPVSPSTLFNTVSQALGFSISETTNHEIDQDVSLAPIYGARVLLAEDNEMNQAFAKTLLSEEGIVVDIANDGVEAVAMVEKEDYAAILMDIQMPELDGYEATRQIRQLPEEKYKTLPIIAMTAHAMSDHRIKAKEVGMNDYVSKPVDPDLLFSVLLKWISPTNKNVQTAKRKVSKQDADLSGLVGLDTKMALKRFAGKSHEYVKVLFSFVERYQTVEKELVKLYQSDIEAAESLCHAIKGVAGNIGADDLYHLLMKLDDDLKAGKVPEDTLHKAFANELEKIRDTIVNFKQSYHPVEEETIEEIDLKVALNDLLKSYDRDIADSLEHVSVLEHYLKSGPYAVVFSQLTEALNQFDIDLAKDKTKEILTGLSTDENDD